MHAKNLIFPCAMALLAASGGAAFAQASASGTAGSPNTVGVGASQMDLTCAQVSALDSAQAPNILYFIAGYDQGRQQTAGAMGGSTDASTTDQASTTGVGGGSPTGATGGTSGAAGGATDTASTAGGANAGASGTAPGTNAGSAAGTDTAAAPGAQTGLAGSNSTDIKGNATDTAQNATGASGEVTGNMAGATDTNATTGGGSGNGGTSAGGVTTMPGFQSIDVAAIMTACQASPNAMVTDVIAAGGAGAGTQ